MAQIDIYRNALSRKRGELVKLKQDLAKEQVKISPLQQKILSAQKAIGRTKSQSTVKSKLSEIERSNKAIVNIQKKIGDIQNKIAKKEKDITTADNNYRKEETKISKKNADVEKRRQQDMNRQTQAMERSIQEHNLAQVRLQSQVDKLSLLPEKITVLFMAANPIDTAQLRLDEEARLIQEKIRLSEFRNSVSFESRWATRSSDILQAINETNPTIVHFSGHGSKTGDILLLNPDGSGKTVSKEAITMTMATASDTIKLVVFNACFSEVQAKNVVEYIEAAIGMSDSIRDDTAYAFAAQLYSSIGFGHSLQVAFDQAKAALVLENIPGENIPQLYARDGIALNEMILVRTE